MKKHYPWLWFDADGTLFNFEKAEVIALRNAFLSVQTPYEDRFLEVFQGINRQVWQALERREITPAMLSLRRFELLVDALNLTCSPGGLSTAFLEQLAQQVELIDGAYDVLSSLHTSCRIAIVTNGLQVVQRSRLGRSPVQQFVSELIISEEVGSPKPEPGFFAAAFDRMGNPATSDVLLIGDSLTSDIQGGINYGLDTCWFNPKGEVRPTALPITYEIVHLRELLDLFV
jgi:YjjG family noncanonical pyrimidine nucleotidase